MTQEPQPTPELLPCPFCGGKPWITEDDHGRARWVSCDTCECDGPSWLGWMDDAADVTIIAAWNQRQPTPRTLTTEQVERAKDLIACKEGHKNAAGGARWKEYWMDSTIELLRELVGDE